MNQIQYPTQNVFPLGDQEFQINPMEEDQQEQFDLP